MSLFALASLAALPWLHGFFAPTASTEEGSHEVVAQLGEWRPADEACIGSSYGGMSLTAELGAGEGEETILASFTQGVVVLDRERHLVAQVPGFECEGTADELVALAVGEAGVGVPLVALAATAGGRAENITWLTLYRLAGSGELQPVFIGEVERHEGEVSRTGVVTIIPGGLVYRAPSGDSSLWVWDAERRRYVEQLASRPVS
jgi:hypothetical protein